MDGARNEYPPNAPLESSSDGGRPNRIRRVNGRHRHVPQIDKAKIYLILTRALIAVIRSCFPWIVIAQFLSEDGFTRSAPWQHVVSFLETALVSNDCCRSQKGKISRALVTGAAELHLVGHFACGSQCSWICTTVLKFKSWMTIFSSLFSQHIIDIYSCVHGNVI